MRAFFKNAFAYVYPQKSRFTQINKKIITPNQDKDCPIFHHYRFRDFKTLSSEVMQSCFGINLA